MPERIWGALRKNALYKSMFTLLYKSGQILTTTTLASAVPEVACNGYTWLTTLFFNSWRRMARERTWQQQQHYYYVTTTTTRPTTTDQVHHHLPDEQRIEDKKQNQRQERKESLVGVLVADRVPTQWAEPGPLAVQFRRICLRINHFHDLYTIQQQFILF